MTKRRLYWIWGIFCFGLVNSSVMAEMPNELEPEYSDAVIDFHTKRHDHSLAVLRELQKKLPHSVEVLELKALNLRALKQDKDAAKVYKELIDLKTKQGRPKKEIAPYAFELGMIRFNEKSYEKAISFFQYSEREAFNLELSKFYLGNCYFQLKKDEEASQYFAEVTELDLAELKPAAHFYLAQVYLRMERQAKGLDRLVQAKASARYLIEREELPESSKSMARQIDSAVDGIFKPMDKGQWFGSVAFLLGYDSNVLLLPNDSGSDTSSSGLGTMKATLSSGLGYATSSMRPNQWIPNIRFGTTRNTNNSTHTGEFIDSAIGVMYNRNPLSLTTWGLRSEAGALFQSEASTVGAFKYGKFSKGIGFGPNARKDFGKNWLGSADYYAKYTDYDFDDTLTDTQRRSGILHSLRLTMADQRKRMFWNPTYLGKLDFSDTKGTEFQNIAYGGTLLNAHSLRDWVLTESLDFTYTLYPDSTADRKDITWTLSIGGAKKLSKVIQFVSTIDYSKNNSSDDATFSYKRFSINAGLSFSL
jgi:tetratricopeptide (TPR) repeat protein